MNWCSSWTDFYFITASLISSSYVMAWIVSLPPIQSPNPQDLKMWRYLEIRPLKRHLKWNENEAMSMEPNLSWLASSLKRKDEDKRANTHARMHTHVPHTHTDTKYVKVAFCKPRWEASEETKLLTGCYDSQPPDLWATMSLLFKPTSVWCLVRAAPAD